MDYGVFSASILVILTRLCKAPPPLSIMRAISLLVCDILQAGQGYSW